MDRIIKLVIIVAVFLGIVVVIRNNVTATKEKVLNKGTIIALELNSELVNKVESKLTLLKESVFYDDTYKYLYFDIGDKEKKLSLDEKLYIVFEELYREDKVQKEHRKSGVEFLEISSVDVKEKMEELFGITDEVKLDEIEYKTSSTCGIVKYLYTDDKYELTYKACERDKEVHKYELEEALKDGDIVKLKLKSFYAKTTRNHFNRDDKIFSVRNFGKPDVVVKTSISNIDEMPNEIFDNYDISSYAFSFELKGEDYYLSSIERI